MKSASERDARLALDAATQAGATLQRALPLLRWSVAFVWFATALVSAFVFPVADSLALLARAGVPESLRPAALYGAAGLDFVFGVLSIAPRRPRWIWRAQIALIVTYMLVITVRLPDFWLHPYGPLTKNVPMLAVLWLLDAVQSRKAPSPARCH